MFTPSIIDSTFIYIILTARSLESGWTGTRLKITTIASTPIETYSQTALSVHATFFGIQLRPAVTAFVLCPIFRLKCFSICCVIMRPSFVSHAPFVHISTVGLPYFYKPRKGLYTWLSYERHLYFLVWTYIWHPCMQFWVSNLHFLGHHR